MLEQIKTLTDIGAMTRLLHESIAYGRSIDDELEVLLSQRYDLEKKLLGLQKSSEVLELVRSDSDVMLSSVRSTCALADHVSGKVRELDLAQSRVQATLARIDVIVDRTNCIDGAKQALETEDYESAAKYVERFLELDAQYTVSNSDEANGEGRDTVSEPRRQLLESKQKLEEVIRKKLALAVEARDHTSVVRFVKLFPSLELQEEGLRLYVDYLRKVIALRARNEYEGIVEILEQAEGNTGDFVGGLNNLFNYIATSIEDNEDLLRTFSGEDGIVFAIQELQQECNLRGPVILKKYSEHRKFSKLSKEIANQSKNIMSVGGYEGPDPRDIAVYLEELQVLIQTSEDYIHYMIQKMREAGSAGAQLSPRAANGFKSGAFGRSVQELTGYYVVLEEYFMEENVRKAIKIDEFVPDAQTTSMVDDCFYVLQTCSRRAVSTANSQAVLATLNHVIDILNNEYKEALLRKINLPNLAIRLFSAGVGSAKTGTEVAAALNNVDISAEYVIKLKHEIEEHCMETFAGPGEREKIKSCLSELSETSTALRQLGNGGLEQLANAIIPRLRGILDVVGPVSYELTEAQYAENEVNDPWVQKLLHLVDGNVAWLQPLLTSNNYDSLVHLIIDFLVKRLEAIMVQKRFNQLGGLQLDRDARTLVGHFSGMTQRTVRDKFARLTQMATILNLEKVSEILDYWGENSGPMTWRLTTTEVRRTLSLRVDFKPESIAALKL
ncbi:hypothetical protein AXG93_1774s1140 [Marchantia polymorpha subsp. ruderalis]|uniref:Conserved oligomeric Golgi complex subunit 4 n=1 Tax=Marchantia polymorpha subsp. ruderalis TaxID=1480154 RepID=A0A176W1R8_MARPO|nr:hypothetical protein AXG93_1774s1140 [Marchantia polymorpha subsp. ruderalis]